MPVRKGFWGQFATQKLIKKIIMPRPRLGATISSPSNKVDNNDDDNDDNDNYIYYYTFKFHSRSLLVNILQLILNVRQLWRHFRSIL